MRLPFHFALFRTTTHERWDWATPLALFGLSAIGVAFIYSAQYSSQPASASNETLLVWVRHTFWIEQVVFLAIGACLYVAVSLIDYRFWLSVSHWIYLVCVVPLVLVLQPTVARRRSNECPK